MPEGFSRIGVRPMAPDWEPVEDRSEIKCSAPERLTLQSLVARRFLPATLYQPFLLPPSLQDWLPADHLARFVAETVNMLDLSAIRADDERRDSRG